MKRKPADQCSRYYVPWGEFLAVAAAVKRADEGVQERWWEDEDMKRAREAYRESRESYDDEMPSR